MFFLTGKVKVFDNVEKRSMDGLTKRMIGIFSVGTYSYCWFVSTGHHQYHRHLEQHHQHYHHHYPQRYLQKGRFSPKPIWNRFKYKYPKLPEDAEEKSLCKHWEFERNVLITIFISMVLKIVPKWKHLKWLKMQGGDVYANIGSLKENVSVTMERCNQNCQLHAHCTIIIIIIIIVVIKIIVIIIIIIINGGVTIWRCKEQIRQHQAVHHCIIVQNV